MGGKGEKIRRECDFNQKKKKNIKKRGEKKLLQIGN